MITVAFNRNKCCDFLPEEPLTIFDGPCLTHVRTFLSIDMKKRYEYGKHYVFVHSSDFGARFAGKSGEAFGKSVKTT